MCLPVNLPGESLHLQPSLAHIPRYRVDAIPYAPFPSLELHGTGATVVPYGGSLSKGYPPVPLWLRQWAERDHCASNPTIFFHQANVIGEKWMGCSDHVTIMHYLIGGMGHTWPQHIVMRPQDFTTTLNATKLIWAFFQDYPLPTGGD